MKIRIYYDATDTGGIVYHTKYLEFCEQARSEIFFSNNIFFENEGYVVKNLEANFIKSAKLGNIIEVKTIIKEIKSASLNIVQQIYKEDTKIFETNIKLVYLKNGKISKIPQKHIKILNEYKN